MPRPSGAVGATIAYPWGGILIDIEIDGDTARITSRLPSGYGEMLREAMVEGISVNLRPVTKA